MNGLIGKKIGMTRVFDEDGRQIPVTVLQVGPCSVVQRKTREKDGYDAVQLGFGEQKEHRLSKPRAGQLKKAEVAPVRVLKEIRVDPDEDAELGSEITLSIFEDATHVDVVSTTKGKGFQGVVKRHGMSGGRATHGSHALRRAGSIGQCVSPARVLKNKAMPGRMGHTRVTVQNLKVIRLLPDDHAIMVNGAVPGPNGGMVIVRRAIKKASGTS